MPLRNAVLSSQAPRVCRAAPRQNRAASPSGIMLRADVAAGVHATTFAAPPVRAAIYKVVGARAVAAVVRAHVRVVGGHAAARKAKEIRVAAHVVRVVPGGPRRDQRLRRRRGADLQVGGGYVLLYAGRLTRHHVWRSSSSHIRVSLLGAAAGPEAPDTLQCIKNRVGCTSTCTATTAHKCCLRAYASL